MLLVWAHLPTDSTSPNLRSPFSFVFQLIRASTTAKAILFRILILSSSSGGIHFIPANPAVFRIIGQVR